MKLTQINKTYRLKIKQNGKISIYTAKILDEDETHIKFLDKFNQEIIINKNYLQEVKCLN